MAAVLPALYTSMEERRSGVDVVRCRSTWAVIYDGAILSLYDDRGTAIAAARGESQRILGERILSGNTPPLMPRLLGHQRKASGETSGGADEEPERREPAPGPALPSVALRPDEAT